MTDQSLSVALLTYRGNPFCGGQGVYVRHLSRELVALGHRVEVFAGPPYPDLDPGVLLTPVPSLDLYREPDPFRVPRLEEYRDWVDVLEVGSMMTAGFPEPLTFSLRVRRMLRERRVCFDVVHDNQGLGYGLLGLSRFGLPLVATVHHPVQVDRRLELAAAVGWRRLTLRRWYGFTRMQRRVARGLPHVVTVSESSRAEIVAHLGVPPQRITVIPVGTDVEFFTPDPAVARVPARVVTVASADVPLKGLVPLLEAIAKVRVEYPTVELVVVGSLGGGTVAATLRRLDLGDTVRFTGRVATQDVRHELRAAAVAVVPSLFEGFSLPAVEAMACGTAVVTTTAGGLPEVIGADGEAGLLVAPGDPQALAGAIGRLLGDAPLRARLGATGRRRVVERFTWRAAAQRTADRYRAAVLDARVRRKGARSEAPC